MELFYIHGQVSFSKSLALTALWLSYVGCLNNDIQAVLHNNLWRVSMIKDEKGPIMAWTTPTLVEICIGLEINDYLPR
jgi:coenzyme PQQ precursor peptide PqqA